MKSKIIFILTAVFALSGSYSSYANSGNPDAVIANNIITKNNSDKAFHEYGLLQKALASDDAAKAQEAAGNLATALKDIQHSSAAVKAAIAINQTNDIKLQRKSFASLSVALGKLFKENKPDDVMIYIHYCPMAKAYWLSDSKKIHNPYYGKSMPSCGKTTGMIM